MITLIVIASVVGAFLLFTAIITAITLAAPSSILCLSCSPIAVGASWRRPGPGESCEICAAVGA